MQTSMDENLRSAIRHADLPTMIDAHYPDARRGMRVRCRWRDGFDSNGQLYRWHRDGRWRLRDWVEKNDVDAYGFLVEIIGLSKSEAARELLKTAGLSGKPYSRVPRLELTGPPALPDDLRRALNGQSPWSSARLQALAHWLSQQPTLNSSEPTFEPSRDHTAEAHLIGALIKAGRERAGLNAVQTTLSPDKAQNQSESR